MNTDHMVERLARDTASRTTRRSFLSRLGRVAIVVAGGPTLAVVLGQDVAEARVCGQSGVSPPCPTFDCDETWGWCWYANGCCADGLLKKICDCCAPNTPNPIGYCPPGTRVLCIVESCGADPRLMTRQVLALPERDPVLLSAAFCREAYRGTVPIAVIGDAESTAHAAIAASLGRIVEGPVLLTGRGGLAPEVAGELDRLGVEFAKVVGPTLSPAIDRALADRGIATERIGISDDAADLSAEAAVWSRSMTGSRRAIAVLPGAADVVVASAAAVALLHRLPLLLGAPEAVRQAIDSPRPLAETFVVSPDAADAGGFPGGRPLAGATPEEQANRLADLLVDLGGVPDATLLVEAADSGPAPALGLAGAPVLLHAPGTLDGARDWIFAHRGTIGLLRTAVAHPSPLRREIQSILNEFEIHLLRGSAGQGLPVIPQPIAERPIGRARR